jgi:SAM-dependent methyltransferase
MLQLLSVASFLAVLVCAAPAFAQSDDDARQIAQERREAELEAPQLAEVLGAGSGRVYATDVTERSLTTTRAYTSREGLTNIAVIAGVADSTNLPSGCCDALFMRNVYHHVTKPAAFNASLYATARPGARVAIIDAPPGRGSTLPAGVPANRGGHGIPVTVVIDEMSAAGFVHVRTIQGWPPGDTYPAVFLALFEKK